MECHLLLQKWVQALVYMDFRYFMCLALTLFILLLIFFLLKINIFLVNSSLFFGSSVIQAIKYR
jgi:hypothetical protein